MSHKTKQILLDLYYLIGALFACVLVGLKFVIEGINTGSNVTLPAVFMILGAIWFVVGIIELVKDIKRKE